VPILRAARRGAQTAAAVAGVPSVSSKTLRTKRYATAESNDRRDGGTGYAKRSNISADCPPKGNKY
jgi:hypothetical protein